MCTERAAIWPGECAELTLPNDLSSLNGSFALKPRVDSLSLKHEKPSQLWPSPCIIASVAGKIRIPNLTSEPGVLKKNEQFCQVRPITMALTTGNESENNSVKVDSHNAPSTTSFHSANVRVDLESFLDNTVRGKFQSLLEEYDSVFDRAFKIYNGNEGPFQAVVNMGPVQTQQGPRSTILTR